MKGVNPFQQQMKAALHKTKRKFIRVEMRAALKDKKKIDQKLRYLDRELLRSGGKMKKVKKQMKQA